MSGSLYLSILSKINQVDNVQILNTIETLLHTHSEKIVNNFYKELLQNNHASRYLSHEQVKNRLTKSMNDWIKSVFVFRSTREEIEEYIQFQKNIGHIHGKIGIPVSLVSYGMYIIKQDIMHLLVDSSLKKEVFGKALILTNQNLDCALQIINESYESDLIINEKDSQAFKLQFSTHHLALDCERLRTSLSDWMRDLLLTIQQDSFDTASLLNFKQSNFGLWISHKAKLLLGNKPDYFSLINLLEDINEKLHDLNKVYRITSQRQSILKKLNTLVSQANWVLSDISKEIIDQDNGRDTLTRLFNRRFLDTVMRYETSYSLKNDITFGVIVIDIDFFKSINDKYGHDNGDKVLWQLAEILVSSVRAGDYVFRYGGEEFLIIFGDVNSQILKNIAEKILRAVHNSVFILNDKISIPVTISIGTAIFDKHPDFQRTIKLADEALYRAKQQGRNQVVTG